MEFGKKIDGVEQKKTAFCSQGTSLGQLLQGHKDVQINHDYVAHASLGESQLSVQTGNSKMFS